MITIEAPAKINLTLEVLRKRPDGYHEICSVVQAISLCDTLRFSLSKSIEIRSASPGWSAEQSIIPKAIRVIKTITGYVGGVVIDIEKRVPLMAGLGGDSSDAAAVLRGLNELWQLGLSHEKLLELAPQLGSDVAFFLYGGTALMEGRGEIITPLPAFPHHYVILVNPATPHISGKTAALYAKLQPSHYTDGQITGQLVQDLKSGSEFHPARLFNTFENVVFTRGTELTTYRSHIRKSGAPHVHLAGSGPALFTLVKDRTRAEDMAVRLKNQGMETHLVETRDCR
ncbi:MAG TPA: 4-(cytidine 5'-diphospho)-2-C-methyl-D-erythritol kinase [Dehalococcoidales bacterium]